MSTLSASPLVVEGQPTANVPRISLLSGGTEPSGLLAPQWLAFLDAMRALGWIDGQNTWSNVALPVVTPSVSRFASELAQVGLDVIVATGLPENQALRQASVSDPG